MHAKSYKMVGHGETVQQPAHPDIAEPDPLSTKWLAQPVIPISEMSFKPLTWTSKALCSTSKMVTSASVLTTYARDRGWACHSKAGSWHRYVWPANKQICQLLPAHVIPVFVWLLYWNQTTKAYQSIKNPCKARPLLDQGPTTKRGTQSNWQ